MERIAWLLFFVSLTYGHIRFGFPTARDQNTGIKGPYPCGPDPFWGPGQANTILTPGKLVITLQETINHIGAPFRIALSPADDTHYDEYILLDQIPHNDKWGPDYGMTNPKGYTLEITIPDIDCPRCSLQVLEIMTDKLRPTGSCCTYPNKTELCPSVYHSCANVQINGKTPIPQFSYTYKGPCGPYTQISATYLQNATSLSWYLEDPNYAPGLNNTCAGWNRSCNLPSGPVKDTPVLADSLYSDHLPRSRMHQARERITKNSQ